MTVAFEFEEKKEEEENAGKVKVSSIWFILVFTCYGQGQIYRSGIELFLCSKYPEGTRHHVSSRAVEEEQHICSPWSTHYQFLLLLLLSRQQNFDFMSQFRPIALMSGSSCVRCSVTKTKLTQNIGRLRINVQPPSSLEIFRTHRGFHIPLKVEVNESFAASWNYTGMCSGEASLINFITYQKWRSEHEYPPPVMWN